MAVDYFLKIDGIPGEAKDHKHKDEIDVLSWSWGESNTGVGGGAGSGRGSGKVNMQDFSFSMSMNKASPVLMLSCANGKHIKEALLTCRRAGEEQQEYLKITFSDLLISSYQTGGSSGAEVPIEQISFNYSKIKFEYAPQDEKGKLGTPIIAGYNLVEQKKV